MPCLLRATGTAYRHGRLSKFRLAEDAKQFLADWCDWWRTHLWCQGREEVEVI